MLNIPDSVKALFKQDGVYKNFRAHFPNGELADITNENIVQESVKFTESVCSQDVFKFGLTEASTIEFETVGVANMYGMTIECSCEIDCSSLSAADKADIAAGTWDGTWDGVNEVFAVPYGAFRVESCPRDHQSMAHRKVTAYTEDMSEPSEFEQKKLAVYGWSKTYDPFLLSLVLGQIASKSPQTILGCGYTETDVSSLTTGTLVLWDQQFTAKDAGGTDHPLTFRVNGKHMGSTSGSWMLNKFDLYRFDYADSYNDYQTIVDSAVSILEGMGIDAAQSGFASLEDLAKANLPTTFKPHELAFNTRLAPKSGEIFYPYLNPVSGKNVETYGVPLRLDMFISGTIIDSTVIPYNPQSINGFSADTPTLTRYSPNDTTELVKVAFESTLSTRGSLGKLTLGKTINLYSFSNAYSAKDVANGYLEIIAKFATAARDGGNRIISISNSAPVSVIPGEYRQMWFDEYNVEPIGTIRYSYTDEAGEEQIVDYRFGEGASIYDMSDNAALKLIDGANQSTIEALLDASFIPNLAPVNFVPIDLSMKGLPYIEAGDAISVTAQDGTVCNSYALRHEISGVQVLDAQIDSQSGLIIDSEGAAT